MYDELARKAIDAALQNQWDNALKYNLQILEDNESEVGALNRVSQAYLQKGKFSEAKEAAIRVLEVDPLNKIAAKRIEKIDMLIEKGLSPVTMQTTKHIDRVFIEEPGKTKVVSLINVCEHSKLMTLNAGDSVLLIDKINKIVVTTHEREYIGRLPDDVANRILYLLKLGNNYSTFIKSLKKDSVQIFIREVKNANSIDDIVSFPQRR